MENPKRLARALVHRHCGNDTLGRQLDDFDPEEVGQPARGECRENSARVGLGAFGHGRKVPGTAWSVDRPWRLSESPDWRVLPTCCTLPTTPQLSEGH